MRHWLLLIVICLPIAGLAQSVVGKVTDDSGQAIPQVRILAEGQQKGTLSNREGLYRLELPPGEYVLIFSHLQFGEQQFVVQVPSTTPLNVQLRPQDLQLETVEISIGKRDPAYAIMEEVIAHKKAFVQQYRSFMRESYTQATLQRQDFRKPKKKKKRENEGQDSLPASDSLRTDSLLLDSISIQLDTTLLDSGRIVADTLVWDTMPKTTLFVESQSTEYFQFPKQYKTVVQAYRDYKENVSVNGLQVSVDVGGEGGPGVPDYETELDNPYLFYLDVTDADFNFYRNLIEAPRLGDRPFISPLHNTNWRIIYKFKLMETYYEDRRVHYRIQFWPRNEVGPYFKGEFIIVDGIWAIKRLEMEVMPATLSYFKEFSLTHQYSPSSDGRWLLDEETYRYKIKDGKTTFHGETIALHKGYILDADYGKKFFRNELRRTEMEAFEKDSSYWASLRPLEMKEEVNDLIHRQDSIVAYQSSPEFLAEADSVYNHLSWGDFFLNGITYRDRPRGLNYYMSPIIEQIQPIGVGGYRHNLGGSIRKTWYRQKVLSVGGNVSLGVVNKDIRGNTRVIFLYNPRKIARLYFRAGNDYTIVTANQTISNIICPGNFIQHRYIGLGHRFELFNGLYLRTDANYNIRENLDSIKLQDYWTELCTVQDQELQFEPYSEFRIRIRLEYTPFQKYQIEPYRKVILGSDWPTFLLEYRKAIPGIAGSSINYDFVELGVKHEFQPGSLGTSRWKVTAGSFLNADSIQVTDLRYFRGSDFIFANPLDNLQMLGRTHSTSNSYVQISYLHDFGGTLLNKIPLIKYLPLQTTVGASMLYLQDNRFWHNEVYAGLQVPFRIKQQRFKAGVFYAGSYTNDENLFDGRWKIGITFFNPIKNEWAY